jgi:hypothetical protein
MVPGNVSSYLSTPDSAGISLVGDIDVRIDVQPDHGWTGTDRYLCGKYATSGNQRGWMITIGDSDLLSFYWSTDGTTYSYVRSDRSVVAGHGRTTIRVVLDVNNGASGHTVTFYQGESVNSSTWSQIGTQFVGTGTTSVYDNTAALTVGSVPGATTYDQHAGRVWAFQLRSSAGGSIVSDLDISVAAPGDPTVSDGIRTWTLYGDAKLDDFDARFYGEISSFPQKWDITGRDAYVDIEAAGPLRRMTQGQSALRSTLYRAITTLTTPAIAYWPMEDGSDANYLGSAISGVAPMRIWGSPTLASFTDFDASGALPNIAGAQFTGQVPTYTSSGAWQVRFLMYITPGSEPADSQTIMKIGTTGTGNSFQLMYRTGTSGNLQGVILSSAGAVVGDSGSVAFSVNGRLLYVSCEVTQNGSDIDTTISILEQGSVGGLSSTFTTTGYTIGRCKSIQISPGGGIATLTIGHIHLRNEVTSLFDLSNEFNAWRNETAGARIYRLCAEEHISLDIRGLPSRTPPMGAQLPVDLVGLIRECESVDSGVIFEARHISGIVYRTRECILNQNPTAILKYVGGGQISDSLESIDDDQGVRNDVTVDRTNGSSARVTVTSGPLSSLDPPDGIGRLPDSVTLNLANDNRLTDFAGWRAYTGTVDAPRCPSIQVRLESNEMVAAPTVSADTTMVDVGDLIRITDPPTGLPPDDIDVICQGYTEQMTTYGRSITWNTTSGGAWKTGVWNASGSRWDTSGSTLSSGVDSSATTWTVETSTGPTWSVASVPYEIDAGGERVTVTGVSGATSPQTLTVTRSVNGIVKSHLAGTNISLWETSHYSI